MKSPKEILKQYWGYENFRPLQLEIVEEVLKGKDCVALLPTGGGKSLCFQVPALCSEGIAVVISPLISLMNDQVEQLNHRGIRAIAISSSLSAREIDIALENAVVGAYKFMYVSPERLSSDLFLHRLQQMNVNLVAIDEAHCVSQWGYDFRPAYLKIKTVVESLPGVPFMALTATAKPDVIEDVISKLGLTTPAVVQGSFTRSNLVFGVVHTESKHQKMIQWLSAIKGSAIVYSRSRKKAQEWAEFLNHQGIPSDFYHAGLSAEVRARKQKKWTVGTSRVMVATTAFGMGIDKGDVRLVLHPELPENPESYIQESGRAGRDGETAYGISLVGPDDTRYLKTKIHGEMPDIEFIINIYKNLCTQYQIAYGTGQFVQYSFDEGYFIKKWNLPPAKTFRALRFLDQQGIISYNQAGRPFGAVRIIADLERIEDLEERSDPLEPLVKSLLRNYGGITSDFVKINERSLGKKMGLDRNDIYQQLLKLSKTRILDYIPKEDGSIIEFLIDRPKEKHLTLSTVDFDLQMKKKEEGLQGIIRYVENTKVCRQIELITYLEHADNEVPCGKCDVCRGTFTPLTAEDESKANELLFNPMTPTLLARQLHKSENIILLWLRERLAEEEVLRNEDGTFVLKK